MIGLLKDWADGRGFRIAVGSGEVLQEVKAELERRAASGELDPSFYSGSLGFFRYERSSDKLADVRSVLMVAMPRPAHRVTFELETGGFDVVIPPTYVRYSATFSSVLDDITSSIPSLQGHLETLKGPLKAIAARLGLVEYGRNNVTYIPDWGSYFQLLGYVSDLDLCEGANWNSQAPKLMSICDECGICTIICPTGAIGDRVLLHAEQCTTLFSEAPGSLQRDLSPDCIFGCLECQESCPMNAGLLQIESTGIVFTREETRAILDGNEHDPVSVRESARKKLDSLGLTEAPLVGRNLRHLITRHSRPA